MTVYFRVHAFERFQHYKDRNPVWIKLYNDLLGNYEHDHLPDASKAHLHAIWLLASRSENRIPIDAAWIAGKIGATEPVDLWLLSDAGFIEAIEGKFPEKPTATNTRSKLLAEPEQAAIPERERETEGETETDGGDGSARNIIKTRAPSSIPESTAPFHAVGSKVLEIMGVAGDPRWLGDYSRVDAWLREGWDPELDIYPTVERLMKAKTGGPPKSLKYFEEAIGRAWHERHTDIPPFLARKSHDGQSSSPGIIEIAQRLKRQMDDEDAVRA